MNVSGIGRVIFWGGGNLWIGFAGQPVAAHSHHAIQIAAGFEEPVEIRRSASADWVPYPSGVLIRPGTPHEFRAPGRRIANILFEPEASLGRALLERCAPDDIVPVMADIADLAEGFEAGASDDTLVTHCWALLSRLAGIEPPRQAADPRVLEVIGWIRQHLQEPISLADAAKVAKLSEGRLRHLFVDETGVAFRPFVLWTRLNMALEIGFDGASWTEAAHATNFADSAHLTRTCRRMYGLVPSSLRIDRASKSDKAIA
jgi:AraC family transcriptional regulator